MIHGPNLVTAVKTACRSCFYCKLIRTKPYQYPKTPPLPQERLVSRRPFAVTGVDYSGPHNVKRGRGTQKVWIVVFTCMVSRAVDLRIVENLSAEAFITQLLALTWTYGQPKVLMSDNATFCSHRQGFNEN